MLLVVERRQQPGLGLDTQGLQFGCVEAEVLPAQRPDAHQLEVATQQVPHHRQFVEPQPPQHATPEVDTVVVLELASTLKALVVVDIGLHILGVGVHRAELVHHNHLAVLADAAQVDDGRACGRCIVHRLGAFAGGDEELALAELLVDHLEAGTIEAADDLHAAHRAVLAACQRVVEAPRQPQLGTHAVPQVVPADQHVVEAPWVLVHQQFAFQSRRHQVAADVGVLWHHVVDGVQLLVELLYGVQRSRQEYQLGRQPVEAVAHCLGSAGGDGHHEHLAARLGLTVHQVLERTLVTHLAGGFEHLPYLGVDRPAGSQLGAAVASGLGVAVFEFVLQLKEAFLHRCKVAEW